MAGYTLSDIGIEKLNLALRRIEQLEATRHVLELRCLLLERQIVEFRSTLETMNFDDPPLPSTAPVHPPAVTAPDTAQRTPQKGRARPAKRPLAAKR